MVQEAMKAWEERMAAAKLRQEQEEKERADKLVQDYLRRTGREELKP